MKKYYIILIAFLGCLGLQAKDMTGLKIYINPGHGGYDSDDRNVAVYPYAQGDTLGFWESSSNLHKGLMLRELLQEQGATVDVSRIKSDGRRSRARNHRAGSQRMGGRPVFLHTQQCNRHEPPG